MYEPAHYFCLIKHINRSKNFIRQHIIIVLAIKIFNIFLLLICIKAATHYQS